MGGAWVFPGGAVDAHEGEGDAAHRAAAMRELEEEAGVTLDDAERLVPFSRWITPAEVKIRFDTHFFLAPVPDGNAEPRSTARRPWTSAGSHRRARSTPTRAGDPARLPDDQAPRAARPVRHRRRAARARARARGRARWSPRWSCRGRPRGCCCPASRATTTSRSPDRHRSPRQASGPARSACRASLSAENESSHGSGAPRRSRSRGPRRARAASGRAGPPPRRAAPRRVLAGAADVGLEEERRGRVAAAVADHHAQRTSPIGLDALKQIVCGVGEDDCDHAPIE